MLLHVGFGNYVCYEDIKAIEDNIDIGYISKIIFSHKLRNPHKLYDFTNGKARECVILLKDNSCVYCSIKGHILRKRYREIKKINANKNKYMLHLGRDNYIVISNIELISGNTKSKPIVSKMKIAKEDGTFIDFTSGEKMRSVLFMKDGTIIVSAMDERTLIENLKK